MHFSRCGLGSPARAAAHAQAGGTFRIQQEVRAFKEPRTYDWSQIANVARGWNEYLVQYNNDATFQGMLLGFALLIVVLYTLGRSVDAAGK